MQNDNQFAAVQRGIKLAGLWKKTRRRVSQWDAICVHWPKSHGLPGWLGHVPIVLAMVLSLTAAILGGLLIGVVIAFVWMGIIGLSSPPRKNSINYDYRPNDSREYWITEAYGLNSDQDDFSANHQDNS